MANNEAFEAVYPRVKIALAPFLTQFKLAPKATTSYSGAFSLMALSHSPTRAERAWRSGEG